MPLLSEVHPKASKPEHQNVKAHFMGFVFFSPTNQNYMSVFVNVINTYFPAFLSFFFQKRRSSRASKAMFKNQHNHQSVLGSGVFVPLLCYKMLYSFISNGTCLRYFQKRVRRADQCPWYVRNIYKQTLK